MRRPFVVALSLLVALAGVPLGTPTTVSAATASHEFIAKSGEHYPVLRDPAVKSPWTWRSAQIGLK